MEMPHVMTRKQIIQVEAHIIYVILILFIVIYHALKAIYVVVDYWKYEIIQRDTPNNPRDTPTCCIEW